MEAAKYDSSCDMSDDDKSFEITKATNVDDATDNGNCADLMIYCGHGGFGCLITCSIGTTSSCPAPWEAPTFCPSFGPVGSGWSDDLDWILFGACEVLGEQ